MVRTQIQLTESQSEQLRRRAAERRVSMAALIREAVDRSLVESEREGRVERAMEAVGKHPSTGPTDVAEQHDRYLSDAFST